MLDCVKYLIEDLLLEIFLPFGNILNMELDRTAMSNTNNVYAGIKNKWNWKWTEEKDCHGVFLSDNMYMRKINKKGIACCKFLQCEINYGNGGKQDILRHTGMSPQRLSKAM